MLTCFSLENVLHGLYLLMKEKFGCECKIKTVILDAKTGEVLDERFDSSFTKFCLDHINNPEYKDQVVYFVIDIENNGTIIMDLFGRPSKFNKYQVSTLTEVGSTRLDGQKPVAYIVDGMEKDALLLGFAQVKTIFHEFGHALNIALSNTKYQYHSCARASMDIAEIPSHFAELYLKDYSFVSKFAIQPEPAELSADAQAKKPMDRDIFRKMLFCDEVFRFMAFEETLMFTSLDIDLNSFSKSSLQNEGKE